MAKYPSPSHEGVDRNVDDQRNMENADGSPSHEGVDRNYKRVKQGGNNVRSPSHEGVDRNHSHRVNSSALNVALSRGRGSKLLRANACSNASAPRRPLTRAWIETSRMSAPSAIHMGRPLTRAWIETVEDRVRSIIARVALSRGRGSKLDWLAGEIYDESSPLTRAWIET